ncbi:MAG: homoserine dehydrogenase [Deltaproteobacteria bacterium]|nr:homoserine dehydrogenase [Deltaproteobacteria bacterium]
MRAEQGARGAPARPARKAERGVRVALIGWGTIGSGVIQLLRGNGEALAGRLGASVELARVVDIDLERRREVRVPKSLLTNDARAVLADPEIDVVIELMGGLEPARTFVLEAIRSGKSVVTANKALLAHHGREIFAAAEAAGVGFGFEASVGGGIPIIRTLREALGGDRHRAIFGIVNGTSNYILSAMAAEGRGFDDVLADAQRTGLAEANPTYDVDGIDAAHKLALLVQLAFGVHLPLDAIHTEGIRHVDAEDMAYARELGYAIKLLAIAKRHDEGIEARVHPTMIPLEDPLASVQGAFNAVCLLSEALGRSMYYGQGAGMMPTATAVVGDVLDCARDLRGRGGPRLPPLGFPVASLARARVRPIGDVVSEYYLRIQAADRPGVLGRISGLLGGAGISIASVVQRGRKSGGTVPVVFRTHETRERDLRRALARVEALPTVQGKPVAIRIEESPI